MTNDQVKFMFSMILEHMENMPVTKKPENLAHLEAMANEFPDVAYEYRFLKDELDIDVTNMICPITEMEALRILSGFYAMNKAKMLQDDDWKIIKKLCIKFPSSKTVHQPWINEIEGFTW